MAELEVADTTVGHFRHEIPVAKLPSDIASHLFTTFAKVTLCVVVVVTFSPLLVTSFSLVQRFFRPDTKLMSRSSTIPASLIALPSDLSTRATRIYSMITLYSAPDKSATKTFRTWRKVQSQMEPDAICSFILTEGLAEPRLRDEIFCQIIKQQLGLVTASTLTRLWELFVFCASCFRPSSKLELSLMNHCRLMQQDANIPSHIGELIKCALTVLLRTKALDTVRTVEPSRVFELDLLATSRPIVLPVEFAGGNHKKLVIDSASTFGEVINALCDKFAITSASDYAVFIVTGAVERVADVLENVCNAVASIEALGRSLNVKLRYKFLFKRRLMFVDAKLEPQALTNVVFPQVREAILDGTTAVFSESTAVELAALLLQHEHGDWIASRRVMSELGRYVPAPLLTHSQRSAREWEQSILVAYQALRGSQAAAVVPAFMKVARGLPSFGMTVYRGCKYRQCTKKSLKLASTFGVGVDASGVRVLHEDTGAVLVDMPYANLIDWVYDDVAKTLCFTVAPTLTKMSMTLFELTVHHSWCMREVMLLMDAYAQALLEKSTAAIVIEPHQARSPDMLSFDVGGVVKVTHKSTSGWFRGEYNGASGYFSANSVAMLFAAPQAGQDLFSKRIAVRKYQSELLVSTRAGVSASMASANLEGLHNYARAHFSSPNEEFCFTSTPIVSSLHSFDELATTVYATDMFVRVMYV